MRCVPGSLAEIEDEKQLRILNQLFVPLSQAMPALAATQDQADDPAGRAGDGLHHRASRSSCPARSRAKDIGLLWNGGDVDEVNARDQRIAAARGAARRPDTQSHEELEMNATAISQLQEQMAQLGQNMQLLLEKLGVMGGGSTDSSNTSEPVESVEPVPAAM